MKKKAIAKPVSILTQYDFLALKSIMQELILGSENRTEKRMDKKLENQSKQLLSTMDVKLEILSNELKEYIRDENAKQSYELKEYIQEENNKQADDIAQIIQETNSFNDKHFVTREEFNTHTTNQHVHS